MNKSLRRTLFAVMLFEALILVGCKEERPVIYSERVAVLPDKSGFLTKEIREIDKSRSELVISEVVGKKSSDVIVVPLTNFQDVRFRFKLVMDTIYLVHTQAEFEREIHSLGAPTFPIKTECVKEVAWLTSGIQEGDPLFYTQEKWGALLELAKRE